MAGWERVGPPGGESAGDLERRVSAWCTGLTQGVHLLVAHAGVVRALRVIVNRTRWAHAMTQAVPHMVAEVFSFATPGGAPR